jgi:hypothetical protein
VEFFTGWVKLELESIDSIRHVDELGYEVIPIYIPRALYHFISSLRQSPSTCVLTSKWQAAMDVNPPRSYAKSKMLTIPIEYISGLLKIGQ